MPDKDQALGLGAWKLKCSDRSRTLVIGNKNILMLAKLKSSKIDA